MNRTLLKKRIMEAPHMEPTDAVKLIYQNEFGCGHLVTDEAVAIERVRMEWEMPALSEPVSPFVYIGNGLCRLNLHSQSVRNLSAKIIARMMAETAANHRGSTDSFVSKLEILQSLCAEGVLPFGNQTLAHYLQAYAVQGYPAVSHSARYRDAYAPAYRVVRSAYAQALPVLLALEKRLASDGRALLVLDGDCTAGKTTLAALLAPLYHATVIPMDDFFLPPELRTEIRMKQPGWNIHHERFHEEVLPFLLSGSSFAYNRYDCQTGNLVTRDISPAPVVIIEGSYSHHPAFVDAYQRLRALRVVLLVDEEEQLRRLQARNGAMAKRFIDQWIPLEKNYLQAYDIRQKADVALLTDAWPHEEDFHEAIGD